MHLVHLVLTRTVWYHLITSRFDVNAAIRSRYRHWSFLFAAFALFLFAAFSSIIPHLSPFGLHSLRAWWSAGFGGFLGWRRGHARHQQLGLRSQETLSSKCARAVDGHGEVTLLRGKPTGMGGDCAGVELVEPGRWMESPNSIGSTCTTLLTRSLLVAAVAGVEANIKKSSQLH